MTKQEKELAAHRMKESNDAFRSGQTLMKSGDHRGAINRFYYAAFYAVQALLILKGKSARTHSGCFHLFREEYVRNGPLPQEANETLSSLFEERMESDYAELSDPSPEDSKAAEKDCKAFLKQAKGLFESVQP